MNPLYRTPLFAAGLIAWTGMLYGALRINDIPGDLGHAICGPWGCGPALQPLIACHSFWLTLLSPGAIILGRNLSTRDRRRMGMACLLAAALGLVGIVLYEAVDWLPKVPASTRSYFLQRCLFRLAILIEAPIVQVALIGAGYCLWRPARRKKLGNNVASNPFGVSAEIDAPASTD